jgi:hypothetical protein
MNFEKCRGETCEQYGGESSPTSDTCCYIPIALKISTSLATAQAYENASDSNSHTVALGKVRDGRFAELANPTAHLPGS